MSTIRSSTSSSCPWLANSVLNSSDKANGYDLESDEDVSSDEAVSLDRANGHFSLDTVLISDRAYGHFSSDVVVVSDRANGHILESDEDVGSDEIVRWDRANGYDSELDEAVSSDRTTGHNLEPREDVSSDEAVSSDRANGYDLESDEDVSSDRANGHNLESDEDVSSDRTNVLALLNEAIRSSTRAYGHNFSSDVVVPNRFASSFAIDSPSLSRFENKTVFTVKEQNLLVNALCDGTPNRIPMGHEVVNQLSQFLGVRTTVAKLGQGSNSSAFVIAQNGSQNRQVLRLFSFSKLQMRPEIFKLTNQHIGGEWLSAIVDDTKVAANTDLLIWQADSFRIIDRQTAKEWIDSSSNMGNNEEITVIGTIGLFIEGSQDLEQVLRERGSIRNEEELRPLLQDLFEGVVSFQEQNICHRDLKLSNVIILPSGGARVIDFGSSARQIGDGNLSRSGDFFLQPYESVVPKPNYTNKKTDSYSLFRLTYNLVTGEDFYPEAQKVQSLLNSPSRPAVFTTRDLEEATVDRGFIDYMRDRCGGTFTRMALSAEIIKYSQKKSREHEERVGMKRIVQDDPKLAGVDERLIDLMAACGTSFEDRRLLPAMALQMSYFHHSA